MTDMANTGDRTWGDLAQTEHFGRISSNYTVVSKADINLHKYSKSTHAGHCMIYARTNEKVFGIYSARATILMHLRFDGYIGFPGGLIDDGEDVVPGLNRELHEEMNFDISKHPVKEEDYVVTHFCPKKNLLLHFYAVEVPVEDIHIIEETALKADDYGEETLGTFRLPLYTMGDGYRGFPAFLANSFVGNSREQLLLSLVHLNIMTEEEIARAKDAKPEHMTIQEEESHICKEN